MQDMAELNAKNTALTAERDAAAQKVSVAYNRLVGNLGLQVCELQLQPLSRPQTAVKEWCVHGAV